MAATAIVRPPDKSPAKERSSPRPVGDALPEIAASAAVLCRRRNSVPDKTPAANAAKIARVIHGAMLVSFIHVAPRPRRWPPTSAAARWRRRAIALVGPGAVSTKRLGDWCRAIAFLGVLGRVVSIEIVAETECHEELAIVVLDAGLLAPD